MHSAQRTFLRLADGQSTCSFDILTVLASDADGFIDADKCNNLKRLFRPDSHNEVSIMGFIKGCDDVYKRLRYFRASVGNSSLIDKFLEDIVTILFNGVLVLIQMTVLGYNPYPILVSISAILVSSAFAIGATASTYFEVRRVERLDRTTVAVAHSCCRVFS